MNYGSISQEIEILRNLLAQSNEVGIVVGTHQSIDTMGAALGLYLSLSQSRKNVQIVSKKDPIVEISNLVGIDKVSKQFKGDTRQLIVSLPYAQGEVGKVSFKEDGGRINFNLTAAEGRTITPFDTQDVRLIWSGASPSLVITIGVSKNDELIGIVENAKIVNIDNYIGNARFGDVVLVDEAFSSLSEIIAKVIKELSLSLDIDSAQNLMDGLSFATRNFTKLDVSPLSFESAGQLMSAGAVRRNDMPSAPQRDTMSAIATPRPQQQNQQRQDSNNQSRNQSNTNQGQNRNRMPQAGQNRFSQQQNRNSQNPVNSNPQMPRQNVSMPQREDVVQAPQEETQTSKEDMFLDQQPQVAPSQVIVPAPKTEEPVFDAPVIPEVVEEPVAPVIVSTPAPSPLDIPDMGPKDDTDIPNDWLIPKVFKGSKPQGND